MWRFVIARSAVPLVRSISDEKINDLLLRVSVLGHATPGRQRSDHLIHGLAVRDRTPCDARANFNQRIFSFHFSESYAGGLVARMFPLLLRPSPLAR
jgi:hypothetical protein